MRVFYFIFTFILFVYAPAYAKDGLLDIQKVKSEGGIEAWLVEDHSVPVIAMEFSFRGAGSALEPREKQGLARMLSNTLDEGAGSLDSQSFQKQLRDHVISLSFSASRDHFSGSLKTLSKNKKKAFELTNLALNKPRFDQEAVNRMRKANQSRIRSSITNPKWIAARILNDKAFEDHPYAQNSGGTLSSLEKISSSDLKTFHKSHLGQNNLVVSVAGDISAQELAGRLDDIFGDLPEVEIPDIANINVQNQGSIFVYEKDIPQTVIEIMQNGIGRDHPDFHKAQVLNFILGSSGFGSRLTKEIRENRGLTYGIYSYFYDALHLKGLAVSTSTGNSNVPEMLQLIHTEFNKMKEQPVSMKELKGAQSYLVGSLPLSLTSTDKIAMLLTSLQLDGLPIDYLKRREIAINLVTVDDIHALSKNLLTPEQFTTVLVGKPDGIENTEAIRSLPNVE